jgi:hypothetical protein
MIRWGLYSALAGAAVALWITHVYSAEVAVGHTPAQAGYGTGILAWIASFPAGLLVLYAVAIPLMVRFGRDPGQNHIMTVILLCGVVANWAITGSLLSLIRNPSAASGQGAPPRVPSEHSFARGLMVPLRARRMLRWALYAASAGGIVSAALLVAYWRRVHTGEPPAVASAHLGSVASIASLPIGSAILYFVAFPVLTRLGWMHNPAVHTTAVLVFGVVVNWAAIGAVLSLFSNTSARPEDVPVDIHVSSC